METNKINKTLFNERKTAADYNNYNTTVKMHTVTMNGNIVVMYEMLSGHIKIDGTEQFKNYEEMVECVSSAANIETVEI